PGPCRVRERAAPRRPGLARDGPLQARRRTPGPHRAVPAGPRPRRSPRRADRPRLRGCRDLAPRLPRARRRGGAGAARRRAGAGGGGAAADGPGRRPHRAAGAVTSPGASLAPADAEGLARLDAELALVAATPPRTVRDDVLPALPAVLHAVPTGVLPVVFTTWAVSQLDAEGRARFVQVL